MYFFYLLLSNPLPHQNCDRSVHGWDNNPGKNESGDNTPDRGRNRGHGRAPEADPGPDLDRDPDDGLALDPGPVHGHAHARDHAKTRANAS